MPDRLLQPAYYWQIFKKVWAYVLDPVYTTPQQNKLSTKLVDITALFFLKLLMLILLAVLMAAVSPIFDPVNTSTSNMTNRFSISELFLMAAIVLPLIEESAFRLSLKFKPLYLSITLGAVCFYALNKLVFDVPNSTIHDTLWIRVGVAIAFSVVMYPILAKPSISLLFENVWTTNFRWIFYASCAAFAIVHFSNYEPSIVNFMLLPLIVMPQIMGSVIYGYTRMNYGFSYAFLLHFFNNTLFVLSTLLPEGDFFA